ncbi:MAG: hypothetical protein JSV80_07565, partial [Acidobacteriota bacterium]
MVSSYSKRSRFATGPLTWSLGIFVIVRIAVVVLLAGLTDRQEFADDSFLFVLMGRLPLSILMGVPAGTIVHVSNHPPLMPLVMVPLPPLADLVGPFVATRAIFVAFEAMAFVLVMSGIERRRWSTGLLSALLPAGWMTTAVFAQEEYLAGLLIVAGAIALAARAPMRRSAPALLLLAVLAGKVFAALLTVVFM